MHKHLKIEKAQTSVSAQATTLSSAVFWRRRGPQEASSPPSTIDIYLYMGPPSRP